MPSSLCQVQTRTELERRATCIRWTSASRSDMLHSLRLSSALVRPTGARPPPLPPPPPDGHLTGVCASHVSTGQLHARLCFTGQPALATVLLLRLSRNSDSPTGPCSGRRTCTSRMHARTHARRARAHAAHDADVHAALRGHTRARTREPPFRVCVRRRRRTPRRRATGCRDRRRRSGCRDCRRGLEALARARLELLSCCCRVVLVSCCPMSV